MTRNFVFRQPQLAIRERYDAADQAHIDDGARMGFAEGWGKLYEQPSGHGRDEDRNCSMFCFGTGTNYFPGDPQPRAISEELHLLNDLSSSVEYEDSGNLLSTFIADEIADSTDLFGDCDAPVPDEFFTEAGPTVHSSLNGDVLHSYVWSPGPPVHWARSPCIPKASSQFPARAHDNPEERPSRVYDRSIQPQAIFLRKSYQNILPKTEAEQHSAPPDTFNEEETNNIKGRKRALSPEGRKNARSVRSVRACGRCHALKAKCEARRPCKACLSTNKRALDFPCMAELPSDRWTHLFTEEMYGHLELKGEALNSMPRPAPNTKSFNLRLHQYFDDPELVIEVIRFSPTCEKDISKSVFPIASDGKEFQVQANEILSPPLIPVPTLAFRSRFRWTLRRWLDCAEIHDDLEWHKTFFREEYGKPWPRAIFAEVCRYYHQVEWKACLALKSSLQATVFAYMIGHSFYVPEEDIEAVLNKTGLQDSYNGEFMFVSPIHVDRFVKAMMYPFFRSCVALALKELQKLCAPNKLSKYARDQILATSIVLLIVAASQQSKAVEKAVAMRMRGNEVSEEAVRKQIAEVEEYIIDLILEIWNYKFGGEIKWASDEPEDRSPAYRARIFRLLDKFRLSYDEHEPTLKGLTTELPRHINERTFGATNIDRVLKKFYECVFPTMSPVALPRSESDPNLKHDKQPFADHPLQFGRNTQLPSPVKH